MMFDLDTVMEKVVYASKNENTFVKAFKETDETFILMDRCSGNLFFKVTPNKIEIEELGRNWHHTITTMEELYEFINVVIYDIDPYIG